MMKLSFAQTLMFTQTLWFVVLWLHLLIKWKYLTCLCISSLKIQHGTFGIFENFWLRNKIKFCVLTMSGCAASL